MFTEVLDRVSGDTRLTTPSDDPIGVSPERVDSYTLTVVNQLFPTPTSGVEFLALLLRLARVKQLSLEMEGNDAPQASVAVISVQSIKQLSELIGWSYESTHKYVVLFCALGLLIKQRNRGMVELHFPLSRYTPPELDRLNALIEQYRHPKRQGKTDKRLKHAERVKQRFLLLYSTKKAPAPIIPKMLTTSAVPGLAEAINDMTSLLHQIPENLPYYSQIDSILHQLVEIQHTFSSGAKVLGRLSTEKVDSCTVLATRKGRLEAPEVDSTPSSSHMAGRLSTEKVDSSVSVSGKQVDSEIQKSTQTLSIAAQTGRLSDEQVDVSSKKVDSEPAVPSNVNVITIINTITLNVSTVALFCCRALDEVPGKRGIYSKLFREIDSDASAITAALIYTLVHRQDGTIRRPPAVFIQRCKDYHQQGIPEESAALVQHYGQMTYTQLLEALQQKKSPVVPSSTPATVSQASARHQTPALTKAPLVPRIPLKASEGMHREAASRLWTQITTDQRFRLCHIGIVPLADGSTYAILIDDTMTEIVRQVAFYSEREWLIRSAPLTCSGELFGMMVASSFREFLNSKGGSWGTKG